MPFTLSHAAAALPFVRTPLVPAALVVGTMAPDLPYYLPLDTMRHHTHSFVGVVSSDVVIGAIALALWWFFLRRPLVDLAPRWLRERLPRRSAVPNLGLIAASLALGAATHVLWDEFTHPGALTEAWPWLNLSVGPLLVHKWIQHSSSVLGAVVICAWVVSWVRRTPPTGELPVVSDRFRRLAWVIVTAAFVLALLLRWTLGISTGLAPLDPGLVFQVARISIGTSLGAIVVVCLVWHALDAPRTVRQSPWLADSAR